MRQYCLAFLGVFLCVGSVVPASAQSPSAKTLKGITTVHVAVEPLAPDAERLLKTDQLQADAELRLRQNGITVAGNAAGIPTLYVNVGAVKMSTTPVMVYSIHVNLFQLVILLSNESASASTWDVASMGFISSSEFGDTVRAAVRDLVDRFVTDYLSVNAKQ